MTWLDQCYGVNWIRFDLLRFCWTVWKYWLNTKYGHRLCIAFICTDKVLWFLWQIENRLCQTFHGGEYKIFSTINSCELIHSGMVHEYEQPPTQCVRLYHIHTVRINDWSKITMNIESITRFAVSIELNWSDFPSSAKGRAIDISHLCPVEKTNCVLLTWHSIILHLNEFIAKHCIIVMFQSLTQINAFQMNTQMKCSVDKIAQSIWISTKITKKTMVIWKLVSIANLSSKTCQFPLYS